VLEDREVSRQDIDEASCVQLFHDVRPRRHEGSPQ
jgi:hypothetical protein